MGIPLNLARQTTRVSLGVSLTTATVHELFNTICADGGVDLKHSVIITALEKLANHQIS